ncbi:hypothetical protein [Aeromonas sp. QDB62]|uniref:hypothetical protein n=1 Tax=Aeromonas sp. QDB62 TaxID=2990499 RepID=UPI0022E08B49|nr:hypothetical protein [Aeromonas sp. QDB62]
MIDTLFWQQLWLNAHLLRPWWLLAYLPLIAIMVLRWRMDEAGNWQRRLPAHLRKALALLMGLAILICTGPT